MKYIVKTYLFAIMCLMFVLWAIWMFSPALSMEIFQVKAASLVSINALKADIGSMLLLMGLLILFYFIRGSWWLKPAIIAVSVLLFTRFISIMIDGVSEQAIVGIVTEFLSLAGFIYLLRYHPTPYNYVEALHPDFQKLGIINYRFKGTFPKKMMNRFLKRAYKKQEFNDSIEIKYYQIEGYKELRNVEVYQKKNSSDNAPVIVAFHGGGFWMYAIPTYKKLYESYILATGAKVVFIDYTLALDGAYPHGVEDCYNTAIWVFDNAQKLGIDKKRIALYGDSAGGALTAAVAQMLRDRQAFTPCFQMMVYPLTDDRLQTESAKKYTGVPIWNTPMSQDAIKLYLRDTKGETPAYAYPLRAHNFSDLPPSYIETAEFDSLKDEAEIYADQLMKAGVEVELNKTKGTLHGFESVIDSSITIQAIERRIAAFEKAFK
ncbi:alpha/beta hydrolase [Marinifilum sp.]|uniref:alpha/beta hydrolase n=1 Tax=Marinifilum sp. TaxID=2033137 RepID=UPI003BAB3D04